MNDIDNTGMTGSSKMPHSHSTPAGVDGGSRTPPTTPRKAGKMLAVRVLMLDDSITMFQVQAKALGRVLFDQVCKQLHLLEADYFGLEYQEPNGTKYWLDLEKPVCRQVGLSLIDPLLRFCVKFYTPDPAQLEEEFTRYLFCLQIKRDLSHGLLQCNDNTAALMVSYIVQAECGDYVIEDYPDHTYLSTYKFVPHQDQELERRIMENHKKHAGQSPAEADLNLLETARRCELYGMKMHPAKDHEGVSLNLAVAHMGIVVYQNYTKINTFSWAKIRKISFKRKRFLIKLHPEGYGYYKDTVEFFFEGRNECKNFWKKCVENHGFFRCSIVKRVMRQKTRVLSRGSSFRYSGKTQKQIVEFVRDNYVKRQTFQRSNSFRQSSGDRAMQGTEGGGFRGATPSSSLMGSSSISAHPLLPLGDPALGTPARSLSCGSMTLDSPTTVTSVSMGGTSHHHRRDDTAMSSRTLTSIDVHSPATPSLQLHQAASHRQLLHQPYVMSHHPQMLPPGVQHQQLQQLQAVHHRISSAGRISPSNSSPNEFSAESRAPPALFPRHPWQRSASCRELYATSFEDSGKARDPKNRPEADNKNRATDERTGGVEIFQSPFQGELDNPVTRYDVSNRSYSAASSKLPSLDHDSIPDRVYSSSYPGTSSLSTESGHEESGHAGDSSHDDLSHDSYELLEREHEFEYPESFSSPRDDENDEEANSDDEDVGNAECDNNDGNGVAVEREMFQMDAETDSFVKHHRTVKSSSDRQQIFKSVLADIVSNKNIDTSKTTTVTTTTTTTTTTSTTVSTNIPRVKSVDRYSTGVSGQTKNVASNLVVTETRIKRTGTQIERKFETRNANSFDQTSAIAGRTTIIHQDSAKKDPVVLQVHKQKLTVLNELKNLKPKHKIVHVDSEVLRDEGIMQPKSRIDDDQSPGEEGGKPVAPTPRARTVRARSIASLEDHHHHHYHFQQPSSRAYVETGSLGRVHGSGEKRRRDDEFKSDRIAKSQEKDRKSGGNDRDPRKRVELSLRDVRRVEPRERRASLGRVESRERRSFERLDDFYGDTRCPDPQELRRSVDERLDSRDRAYESRGTSRRHENRVKSVEQLDRSPKEKNAARYHEVRERRERSIERLESRRSPGRASFDYDQRHTLERFDSGSKSPRDRPSPRVGKSVDKLDLRESRPTFDFDPRTIERLSSLEHPQEPRPRRERRGSGKTERKSLERLDSREKRASFECVDRDEIQLRKSDESLEPGRRSSKSRGKSEDKPRERDDWKSLERARKDDERREREKQARLSLEKRTETIIGVPNERESVRPKFTEYEPKILDGIVVGFDDVGLLPGHNTVERTKSDPNPGRPRISSAGGKRHMLMHQKSIDLTPADSGDEDPFSDSGRKSSADIPYTLHKRHVMNGTANDEKSESDSGKSGKKPKDLPKLPLKMVTDISCLDLTKLVSPGPKLSPDKPPKGILISPDRHKNLDRIAKVPPSSPGGKLSPTDPKNFGVSLLSPKEAGSPAKTSSPGRSPKKTVSLDRRRISPTTEDNATTRSISLEKKSSILSPTEPNVTIISVIEKRSPKLSPTDPSVTIVSVIEKSRSPDSTSPRGSGSERSPSKARIAMNLAEVVGMEIKRELERREIVERLKVPDDSLEKQDSIEKMPLPEIPIKPVTREKPPLPIRVSSMEKKSDKPAVPMKPATLQSREKLTIKLADQTCVESEKNQISDKKSEEEIAAPPSTSSKPGDSCEPPADSTEAPAQKSKILEKPSIPEKTKRILDRIESRFSEMKKNSPTRVSRPRIIDTGYDDFVDPVAELPLDEVPVKPALELDSLKVPDFTPFMFRHGEPLRSKSLSLAEDKAPIDTLLSPEVENKTFGQQEVSPKRGKRSKSEPKKDFKKQSKSLEGDKPPLKKSGSRESRISPASSTKIDKSKLKLGEMPQEIIIIDTTDCAPEVSIVQKARSKSITRLPDRSFSGSKEEKDDPKKPRGKSASVDEELIKGAAGTAPKTEKQRPKSLGISKSLGSTENRDSSEKVSPKKTKTKVSADSAKPDVVKSATPKASPSKVIKISTPEKGELPPLPETPKESAPEESPPKSEVEPAKKVLSDAQKSLLEKTAAILQKSVKSPISVRKEIIGHARLGVSEGSAIGPLQRQPAMQSPTAQRRAKSLDAPVIPLHKLPPANAFSSKDDTVDILEEDPVEYSNLELANQIALKQQTQTVEVSPNHRSDSTDHTTIPEVFTDSMTETSAQYLESPLTECQEIAACPDLIPYEHDAQQIQLANRSSNRGNSDETSGLRIDGPARFIDQSSVESGAETDALQDTSADVRSSIVTTDFSAKSPMHSRKNGESRATIAKIELSSDSSVEVEKKDSKKSSPPIEHRSISIVMDEPTTSIDREEVPNVTVSSAEEPIDCPPIDPSIYCDLDAPDMVKSPIQISIEECSDPEAPASDEIQDDILDQAIYRAKQVEKPRLDSGDTSEDTLDALDAQIQMQTVDSDVSSPDYGIDRMDEKTLVEVELTPEYLEMRKEDDEATEELPVDEETPSRDRKEHEDEDSANRLDIDKKYRLSTERSRSEETNTWTPDREDPDSSSCSIARPLGIGQIQYIHDRREIAMMKESRKESSLEEESNGANQGGKKYSSQPQGHPQELSSTWKPFPLESSGSSSLDDGWMPQDDLIQQQSQSEDSNGPNEDSFQEDLDFPGSGLVYPINPEVMANYGAFALSRTLSRISERSTTSEQDKSDLEDSFKPSSRSPSLDDESLISSDHQPSLSSDPPSGTALPSVSEDRRTSSELPDIPIDVAHEDDTKSPKTRKSRLQLQASEDWPTPPSSPLFDTRHIVGHVETYYMEMKPEEAVRVTVTDSTENTPGQEGAEDSDSSDENHTLHDDLHSTLMEDGQSSASATTVDGTVKIAVKPKSNSYITGSSHSEDTSMGLSMSEWSSSNNTVRQFCQYSGTKSDDNSLAELGASISDWSGSTTVIPQQYYSTVAAEKSQSDTTTSEKSVTSMRPNSKCQHFMGSPESKGGRQETDRDDAETASGGICPEDSEPQTIYHDDDVLEDPEAIDEFIEARKFVESQFDEHRRRFDEPHDQCAAAAAFADISPPRITFQSEYEDVEEQLELPEDPREMMMIPTEEDLQDDDFEDYGPLPSIPGPIPEEDEDQLYDNVPAMKYPGGDQGRLKVSPGDSSEDMHERFADLSSITRVRSADEEWSFDENHRRHPGGDHSPRGQRFVERGYSDPANPEASRLGTKSTERPVVVPTRAKSTPYYSTTSLSGESTTSSPPMQVRTQIRTKTMAYYSSCRSPQSEGDTSSSMDSPGHTPDRGQRAYRRKRQQNPKRRHRVAVDLQVRGGHLVSSTDSSFDVTSIPPPLLPEPSIDIADEDELPVGDTTEANLPTERRNR